MATQSVSGNRYSASGLRDSLKKLNELTSDYKEKLSEIQKVESELSGKELKGRSTCIEEKLKKLNKYDSAKSRWCAYGIKYDECGLDVLNTRIETVTNYCEEVESICNTLSGTSRQLDDLADQIAKYQTEINGILSGKVKEKALAGMISNGFASNKYDAKNGEFISPKKVSKDLEDWEGDLDFERQDNGTYLVVKVGKDGSRVYMGYTTKDGKNAYYKEAKEKVLNTSKENNTSSKEKTTSSKENNTSDSNEVASNSIDDISEDEVSKNLKSTINNSISLSSWHKLTESEKKNVSKLFIEDLKKQGITKEKLEGCKYSYWTERIINNGKLQKVVHIDATKRVAKDARSAIKTIRVADGKYTFDDKG